MLAALLVHIPLALFPLLQVPQPAADCELDVLSLHALEARALDEFDANIQDYVELRQRLGDWTALPPLLGEEDEASSEGLRAAIVAVRPLAQQGDVFAPSVAQLFRARLDVAWLHAVAGPTVPLYEPRPGDRPPAVNERLPIVLEAAGWPALVNGLPGLPAMLGYAFWGRDLLLVDVPAGLVVDVLPNALPEGARPAIMYR
jgi:hypothetical protein